MAFITINKNNFFHNLNIISKQAGGVDKIALVLKDNAYGHGLKIMANLAYEFGVRHAVVRNLEEAEKIETLFETILVLSDLPTQKCNDSIRFAINSIEDIKKIVSGSFVELKVNTGMNRNGINENELEIAISKINEKNLTLTGLFTHHSSADSNEEIFKKQNDRFNIIKKKVLLLISKNIRFHSANSASLFRAGLKVDEDIARVGIGAYGCLDGKNLKPVLSLHATKIATRELQIGDCVGYDATYEAKESESVSTYDVGYADGFSRLNKEYFTPRNYKLLGRVSMDNITLKCTDEEVILFNDAKEYAKVCDTISYEVLVRLASYLKRVVID